MIGYSVYIGNFKVTTVYYLKERPVEHVKRNLIDHDGMPSGITVEKEGGRRETMA